jgi:hypothetical protein
MVRQLNYRYGSGRLREQVVSLLHHEADQLLHGTYSAKTGKALLTAVAQATKLAQRSYESLRPEGEPPWQGLYTEAAFAADLGTREWR